jgi:23S rRNA pseudouridine1911/1915/1917 synthase
MEQYGILYEDEDLLVVDKFGAMPVQKDKTGDASLQDMLFAELSSREESGGGEGKVFLEAAHRVDRRASGAVIFAKTAKALSTLEAAFRSRSIVKTYVACVEREPPKAEGRLDHVLVVDKRSNTTRALAPDLVPPTPEARRLYDAGQRCSLGYRLNCRSERYFFLDVSIESGKHHQIRAQLSAIGNPIRGDLKYGARRSCESGRIMLHARKIAFKQPRTGARLEILAPFPEDESLWKVYESANAAADPASGEAALQADGQALP